MYFMAEAITLMAIFLFGTLGELLTEKSGHLNLGTPGIVCLGASGTMVALSLYSNMCGGSENTIAFLAIVFALIGATLFAAIGGLIFSFFCVSLKSNQNVVGLCLTTAGVGIMFLIQASVKDNTAINLVTISKNGFCNLFPVSWVNNTGWFGTVFLNHGFFVYLSIILAIVVGIFLRKTNIGLSIKSIGENPATADAVGINVTKIRYLTTIVGAAIAGLAGIVYVMDFSKGTPGIELEALGWISVALVIASLWVSEFTIATSLVFAMLYLVPSAFSLGGTGPQAQLFKMLPYLITLVILILTSIMKKRELQAPDGLGLNYFREDR